MNLKSAEFWVRQVALAPVVRRLRGVSYWVAFVWRRLLFRTTFIAITGSMGKTTAKECLGAILSSAAPTFKSPRNAGGGLLVTLNMLRVRPWHRYAVIELAVSGKGQMSGPARMVRPDVALILNVKKVHATAEYGIDDIEQEKGALLRHLRPGGLAILNRDDERVARMKPPPGCRTMWVGTGADCDYQADGAASWWPGRLNFRLRNGTREHLIRTQLVGTHWTNGCAAAVAAADAVGVGLERSAAALETALPFPGRLSPFRLPSGAIVLRGDYSAALTGLEATFEVMKNAEAGRRLLVVTDFAHSEGHRRDRLRFLATKAAESVDVAVFVGSKAGYGSRRAVDAGIKPGNAHGFDTQQQAAEFLRHNLAEEDLALIMGRTTDHTTRMLMAQLGEVSCWKTHCTKRMLCDICWELGLTQAQMARAVPVIHEWDRP